MTHDAPIVIETYDCFADVMFQGLLCLGHFKW